MGDGTAWGGRLPCKQKFRWDRYPYPPPVVVLYTDLLFQLPPMRQTRSNTDGFSMWLAAKDHLKINEGEVKEVNDVGVTEQA